jgi:hypothetical protein
VTAPIRIGSVVRCREYLGKFRVLVITSDRTNLRSSASPDCDRSGLDEVRTAEIIKAILKARSK